MPRNITVTFADGSTHIYQNTPDAITPEEVTQRATKEFNKQVTNLDGGAALRGTALGETAPAGDMERPPVLAAPVVPNLAVPRKDAGYSVFADEPVRQNVDIKETAGAITAGAATGFALPSILKGAGKVLQKVPYAPVKAAGTAMVLGAPFIAPAPAMIAGAVGGGSGNVVKQKLEIAGIKPSVAAAADLVTNIGAPAVFGKILKIATAATSALPIDVDKAARSVAQELGMSFDNLSQGERKIIEDTVKAMKQGGEPAAKELFEEIKKGGQRIASEADAAAQAREAAAYEQNKIDFAKSTGALSAADDTLARARSTVNRVGDPNVELTDIGGTQRAAVLKRFEKETLDRDETYKSMVAVRDDVVKAKEANKEFITDLPLYTRLNNKIKSVLLEKPIPAAQGVAPETEQLTLSAFRQMRDALSPVMKPVSANSAQQLARRGANIKNINGQDYQVLQPSFNAIDTIRRKLGDAAFGQGEEGFKALGQARAKEWYGYLSKLQSNYAGAAHTDLQKGYELASGLLADFKGGAGAAVLKTEKLAPEMFVGDAKDIPAKFFGSRTGVEQLQALTQDPDLVLTTASNYLAKQLSGKTGVEARAWLEKNSDFLSAPQLKPVLQKAVDYVDELERAGDVSKGLTGTAKGMEKQSDAALANKLAEAENIRLGGKNKLADIVGDAAPEMRIAQLLSSNKMSDWVNVSDALQGSEQGRTLLAKAVSQHIANIAERSPKSFSGEDALKQITEPMLESGLVDRAFINGLEKQLRAMREPAEFKLNWFKEALARGIATFGAAQAGTGIGMVPNMLAPPSTNQNALAAQ
jgi:hypothetical protein